MVVTGLAQDERFQQHLTGAGHPERPQRLKAIATALRNRGLDEACRAIEVTPVDMRLIHRIHSVAYVDRLRQACAQGRPYIDAPDSGICELSCQIAQLAAGAAINAVEEVMAGRLSNAFCAVRPPGHHTEHNISMGFCLLNNIAIAAQYLIDNHGLSRVLILDWDVHHGNGTQHTFESDPRVLFVSLHGHPALVYPGTGHAHECGKGPGEGFTVNLPMLPPSGSREWQRAFDDPILPRIDEYKPQFVLISAGFDAHRVDPLAPLELETECFGWMTDQLVQVAKRHCHGRIVSFLEGGYDLEALGDCVSLHVERLLDA